MFCFVHLCFKNCNYLDCSLCMGKVPSSFLYSERYTQSLKIVHCVIKVPRSYISGTFCAHTHMRQTIMFWWSLALPLWTNLVLCWCSWSLHRSVLFSVHLLFTAQSFTLAAVHWCLYCCHFPSQISQILQEVSVMWAVFFCLLLCCLKMTLEKYLNLLFFIAWSGLLCV